MPPPARRNGPDGNPGRIQGNATSGAGTSVTVSPMRRRRDAANRLPVLPSGYHDPLDEARQPVKQPGTCDRAVLGADGKWRRCCRAPR
jgi:hypothetical protein